MATRGDILEAYRKAGEVLAEHNAKARIKAGYTRIDPVAIAGEAGVAVVFKPMDKLLGAFIREERPGIILNLARSPGLLHMTCAHELGHFFLDHPTTADTEIEYSSSASPIERQADQFAYALMAPQWLIVHIIKKKKWNAPDLRQPQTIYQLSLRLGTSYTSTVWTLARIKLIDLTSATKLASIAPKLLKQMLLGDDRPANWHSDVWLLDNTDRDLIIEPRSTDSFVIDLPNHASAGYAWSVDNAKAEGFHIKPMLHDVTTHSITPQSDHPTPIGAQGTIRCVVRKEITADETNVVADEKVLISLVESQPWLKKTDTDDRIGFAAEYEALGNGLSQMEIQQRINEVKDLA